MRETWYCIYNCYGLSFESGTEEEMRLKAEHIKYLETTEAGTDGRKIKFYFVCNKDKFMSLISAMMV